MAFDRVFLPVSDAIIGVILAPGGGVIAPVSDGSEKLLWQLIEIVCWGYRSCLRYPASLILWPSSRPPG
jgi:hypothetical protein